MPTQSAILACSSTPAAVGGTFTAGGVGQHGYIRVLLKSLAGTAYLGDSGVTTAGYPVTSADAAISVHVGQMESLWVASSSGATATLAILRVGDTT